MLRHEVHPTMRRKGGGVKFVNGSTIQDGSIEPTSEILPGIDPSLRINGINPPGEDLVAILLRICDIKGKRSALLGSGEGWREETYVHST